MVVLSEGSRHPAPGAGPMPSQVHSAVSAARLLSLNTRGYTVSTTQRRKKRRHVLLVMLQFSQIIKFTALFQNKSPMSQLILLRFLLNCDALCAMFTINVILLYHDPHLLLEDVPVELVVAVLAGVCQQVPLLSQPVLRQLRLQAARLPAARPRPRQALRQTRPLRHQAWRY